MIVKDEQITRQQDAFIERMLQSASGVFDIFSIYIGSKLGLYDALVQHGPLTASELAGRTRTHERYIREWLEQQSVTGILQYEEVAGSAGEYRFTVPPGHVEVLVERDSLNYLTPLAQLLVGAVHPITEVLNAYRQGGGVPYSHYGPDLVEGQANMNRAMFLKQLGQEWLPAIPDVHARLMSETPARVADIGCGAGWSSIGIALHYPNVRVDGFDLDQPSIEMAQAHARQSGVNDRVNFQVRNAGDPSLAGNYDLVTAFECIHDLSQPVEVLKIMRQLAGPAGTVLVVDERVGDSFDSKWGEVDWMMYGWSILHCLPAGMADQPSSQTGTVMRTATLRRYAEEAGFREVEVLPIDHFFFRFYRLKN